MMKSLSTFTALPYFFTILYIKKFKLKITPNPLLENDSGKQKFLQTFIIVPTVHSHLENHIHNHFYLTGQLLQAA